MIIYSDIQYFNNPSKSFITNNGTYSWLQHQLDVTEQIFKYALENMHTHILHNGDLFEEKSKIDVALYNEVWSLYSYYYNKYEFIFQLNCGNHDTLYLSNDAVLNKTSLKPFSSIAGVIDRVTDIYNYRIIPYGMCDSESLKPNNKVNILFIHEDIQGLSYGTQTFKTKSGLSVDMFEDWKLVFNGHIHKPQRIKNIYVIGSPMIQDWSESEDKKGFIHLHQDDSVEFIQTNYPRFYNVDKLTKKAIKEIDRNDRDFFKIKVTEEEFNNDIFKKFNVSANLIQTDKTSDRVDLFENKTLSEEIENYIDIKADNLDKETLLSISKQVTGE